MIFKVMETHKLIEMKKYKLGELIDVTRGMSLPGDKYAESGDLIRLTLGNFNLQGNGFKPNTSKTDLYYTGSVKKEFIMKKGDIITPLTEQTYGLLGSTARIPESGKYIQSQDVALIRSKSDKLYEDFCYYLISSPSVRKQLGAAAQQTKIRHTSPDKIKDCEVIIPEDVNQQIKITNLLNTIENKIALNNKTNTELENMAKTIYDYWFTQFDFPDKNGHPYKTSGGQMVYNETLKREIPAGWDNCTFNYYIERITNGLNPRKNFVLGNGNNYYVTIRSLLDNDIDWNNCDKCDDEALQKINSRSQLQIGDVIFSAIGTIGRTYRIYEEPKNWNISETSFTIRPKKDIPHDFFYCLLRSPEFQLQSEHKAMGSTLKCLVMDSFCEIPCIKVDLSIANKFSTIVAPMYKQIYDNNKQNRELTKLRDYLLPLLMNGQIEVK